MAFAMEKCALLLIGLFSALISAVNSAQSTHALYLREIVRLAPPQSWYWPTLQGKPLHYSMLPTGSQHELRKGVDIAVIGDSFAHPMAGVFNKIASDHGLNVMLASAATCAPFFDNVSLDTTTSFDNSAKNSRTCKTEVRPAMLALLKASGARVAVLNGNWVGTYQIWNALKNPAEGTSLQDTIHILRKNGIKVVVIGMVPGSHYDIPLCHLENPSDHGKCPGTTPIKELHSPPHMSESERRQMSRNKMRETLARIFEDDFKKHSTQVALVDPYSAMCTEANCLTKAKGESLYYDDHHLAVNATLLMQPYIEKAFRALEVKAFL